MPYTSSRGRYTSPTAAPLLVFLCLLLPGCIMVGPDYQTPEAQVAERWSHAQEAAVVAGTANHESWWKNFQDPTLNELIDKAYSQNLGLQIAGLRVYEARALLGIVTGYPYPQSQSLGGSASTNESSENAEPANSLPLF